MPTYDELPKYLHKDCRPEDIPDEIGGKLDTDQALADFITYRKAVDSAAAGPKQAAPLDKGGKAKKKKKKKKKKRGKK
jgi:hypothetical protein